MHMRLVPVTLWVLILCLAAAGDVHAVIYKYVNEKGDVIFADDLQKVPEQKRASAVMVSGGEEQLAPQSPGDRETERARLAGIVEAARQERARMDRMATDALRSRIILSASSAVVVGILLFALAHIDVLRERRAVLNGIRAGLVCGLLVLLAVVHGQDVAGVFRSAGDSVSNPLAEFQDKQAARGKKAAAAMRTIGEMIDQADQKAQHDAQQIEKRFEAAEQGK